jgi:hypothetical protein
MQQKHLTEKKNIRVDYGRPGELEKSKNTTFF